MKHRKDPSSLICLSSLHRFWYSKYAYTQVTGPRFPCRSCRVVRAKESDNITVTCSMAQVQIRLICSTCLFLFVVVLILDLNVTELCILSFFLPLAHRPEYLSSV
mmetsp:Transcript_27144/g.64939  ORF Transcript_27144/g.64939 Transcript_27144/m.64939 type:complete len:105 (-) Transcript_27144:647-961(-)